MTFRKVAEAGSPEAADSMGKALAHYADLFSRPGIGGEMAEKFAGEDLAAAPLGRAAVITLAREALRASDEASGVTK